MRRPRRSLLLASLLLALASLAQAPKPPPPVGKVTYVRNQVLGAAPEQPTVALAVGDPLVLRHQVATLADSGTRMSLGESGTLSLGAATRVVLDELFLQKNRPGKSRLSLLVGSLRLAVGSLFGGELEVDTPTGVIGVKGTDFRVDVSLGRTEVTVFEGTVTFLGKVSGKVVKVARGQRSVVEGSGAPSEPAKADPARAKDPAEPGGSLPALGGPAPPPAGTPPGSLSGPPPSQGPGQGTKPGQGAPPKGESGGQPTPGSAGEGSGPRISGCSPLGQAGERICVCGNFPGRSAAGLRLNGQPLEVLNLLADGAIVRLPESTPAGPQTLTGDPKAGFGPKDRCSVGVLVLKLTYEEPLEQGRRTQLVITVEGTRDKVPVRLQNLSPQIIQIAGGAEQVVTTRGGRKNTAKKGVRTLGDGLARVHGEIETTISCPCRGAAPR
ncbi:MAG: FecR family protein [Thermoanaerobaculia bacterium]